MEDLAEKELMQAAKVINNAVAKLKKSHEDALKRYFLYFYYNLIFFRRETPGINIDQQNITEAILEACGAIGNATAVMMDAAAGVQSVRF